MRERSRRWWAIYALGALLSFAAMGWLTHLFLELERAEARARSQTEHQASLRLALWRMDSWLGPLVAREAARGFHEYSSFYAQEQAYTRVLATLDPGEVLAPSPLLTFRSEHIRLHFEIDAQGRWSSPQVPEGNELDLAQGSYGLDAEVIERRAELEALRSRIDPARLAGRLAAGEGALVSLSDQSWIQQCQVIGAMEFEPGSVEDFTRNSIEQTQRAIQAVENLGGKTSWNAAEKGESANVEVRTGPLVPVWMPHEAADPDLIFLRRVVSGAGERLQGFAANWPRLSGALLAQVHDLLPVATLAPRIEGGAGDASGLLLATLPAAISAPPPPDPGPSLSAVGRLAIALPWLAVAAALVAVGFTLRASIEIAERRSRFASSVTHELRTPLTTFRMYSEMLAKDMVPAEKRASYHETLERESARLSGLVESVLAYSRLEEGRARAHRECIGARELIERSRPDLERRALLSGALLSVDVGNLDGGALTTDPAAVHQILFNLVDNACKYGLDEERPEIEIGARFDGRSLVVRVRDHGPGIPPGLEERVFAPFDRGTRDASDPHPGIGLGLALARGLARDLGGRLELVRDADAGACFRLILPPG